MTKSRLLNATILALFLTVIHAPLALAGHKVIGGPELETMMKDGKKTVIVDVREPELFQSSHIPGAINIPYDAAHGRISKELSPSDRIVFVCHGGPMGDELAEILMENGFKDVYNLAGGMRRWKGLTTK